MSDLHGLFPAFDRQPAQVDDPHEVVDAAEPVPAAEPAPVPSVVAEAPAGDAPADDGFDRGRVLRLLDRLERDVAAVETAMVHVEAGEHEAYAAAVATLDVQPVD
jgi:hypothetical protein